jgi:hypothetical protein
MSVKSIERRLCSSFYDMAWLNLSAGIENLPERAKEDGDGFGLLTEVYRKLLLTNGQLLTDALKGGDEKEIAECTTILLSLRETLSDLAEELTVYRAEGRLLRNVLLRREASEQSQAAVNTDDEVCELLGKMFQSDDPMITNLRIRSMVAAFPARMTRNRFYDRIAGYLSLYNGQEDGEGLDAFCYRLRGAAAIRNGGESGEGTDSVKQTLAFIDGLLAPAREAVGAEGADAVGVCDALGATNAKMDTAIGDIESITRCVNALAAIGLLSGMDGAIRENSSVADDLQPAVGLQLREARGITVDETEYADATARAHAAMEEYFEPLSVLMETETGRLQAEIDKMDDAAAEAYIPVMKAARLMSTSAFASLESEVYGAVTPEKVEECRDALARELDGRFEGQPKAMVREIMAAVLAELPVWFESRTEVMEYMLQSLQGCRTDGERRFAIRLLRAAL